jgi:hypothetical protein
MTSQVDRFRPDAAQVGLPSSICYAALLQEEGSGVGKKPGHRSLSDCNVGLSGSTGQKAIHDPA